MKKLLLLSACVLLLAACDDKDADKVVAVPVKVPVVVPPQPELPKKDFIGRWNGPDGTYMIVEAGRVKIKAANEEEKTYENATINDRSIVFNREGTIITARAGNGDDTGVPSFAGKADCIVIKHGEGYCRD